MMVYNSQQCQVASLQLTANCDIKRSGEPSRLSLRKQWIFRCAWPDDIVMKYVQQSANLRFRLLRNISVYYFFLYSSTE